MAPPTPSPHRGANPSAPPRCPTCRHHFVTYDPQLPHGCHLFGIRTQALPSVVVQRESGAPCGHHEKKPRPPGTASSR